MAVGLRQRDTAGNVLVDITTRLPRIMGRVALSAGVNGSVMVPVSGSNPIFYYFAVVGAAGQLNASPRFTISGDTISWQYLGARYPIGGVLAFGRY